MRAVCLECEAPSTAGLAGGGQMDGLLFKTPVVQFAVYSRRLAHFSDGDGGPLSFVFLLARRTSCCGDVGFGEGQFLLETPRGLDALDFENVVGRISTVDQVKPPIRRLNREGRGLAAES